MAHTSDRGHTELEQHMAFFCLLRMNRLALENRLISEEVYRKIEESLRRQAAA